MSTRSPQAADAPSVAGLDRLRHSAAHLLAEAVKELYPDVQMALGPTIEDGFYYDFARCEPFTPDDVIRIEARMREIVDRAEPVVREEWNRDQAIAHFSAAREFYKLELIRTIPEEEPITVYRQGTFLDLCRGPHLETTAQIGKAFKLLKVAGAYWRGDSRNPMLQRIYGTAWPTQGELEAYLLRLGKAERRDHRRLGREMHLFHFGEEAPGAAFWHPKGWSLFQTLVNHLRRRQTAAGYTEINTPDIMDRSLWEASGHWEKFGEHMFTAVAKDARSYVLKPMNCPGGVQVFRQSLRSYRELPLRLAEFGKVHRFEPSGALHGLMRVRAFTQDDAHIFCAEEQVAAEEALRHAVESTGLPYTYNPGEGAFYGPKLEFVLRDAIGREWQCGTLQVDLNLPGRLGACYIAEDGQKRVPVMLHRALLGSIERFTGILLEHYAGWLPLWLAPLQIIVTSVTSETDGYAMEVAERLRERGLRVETDVRYEKIGYKVREHTKSKIPLLIVVGKREENERSLALRWLNGGHQENLALEQAIPALADSATAPQGSVAACR